MNRHLISTRAKPRTCPGCGAPTLTALDRGLPATVDATPIDPGPPEITALLAGKWTYILLTSGYLLHRDADRIHARTPGNIHAQHACPQPTLTDLEGK